MVTLWANILEVARALALDPKVILFAAESGYGLQSGGGDRGTYCSRTPPPKR
jgi:hypothetical protein